MYCCFVAAAFGSTIVTPPLLSLTPSGEQLVFVGDKMQLKCSSNTAAPSLQWTHNEVAVQVSDRIVLPDNSHIGRYLLLVSYSQVNAFNSRVAFQCLANTSARHHKCEERRRRRLEVLPEWTQRECPSDDVTASN